jgi:predicted CoA-binding protein
VNESAPDDDALRALLEAADTVAVVGLSSKPDRPSFEVAAYLQRHGYRIVPVNPNEREVLGEPAYPSLLELPAGMRVDVVDVFRRPEHTPEIARQAVAIGASSLWLQEGVMNEEAEGIASEAGLAVIMDRCIKRTRERVMGEAR